MIRRRLPSVQTLIANAANRTLLAAYAHAPALGPMMGFKERRSYGRTRVRASSSPHKREIESIRACLEMYGATVYVMHQSGRIAGSAGIPDLYIQFPMKTRFVIPSGPVQPFRVWWEVKVGRDTLRPAQVEFLQREIALDGFVLAGHGDLTALVNAINPMLHRKIIL